ncbi:type IX secretion system protein PorG [Mucilaginibacter ginkgonis]|uniref:Outer membrane beta-barrel protein n=1 Tax=Mucilaginibacter ginkgonis TaxID=2682091 RepID=A0A6I4I3E3_9SPHI|nr:DUF6089 family protein [Mucilaginibacter ginkgonis]QQL48480.1 outer membrane beta-barrel protein [Mucilaginibacter ginkgonis]
MRRLIFTLFLTGLISFAAKAQLWEVGVNGGGAGYIGDLNQHNPFKMSGPAYGGFIKHNFTSHYSLKVQYMHGIIAGADSTSKYQEDYNRNLSFRTPIDEGALIGEFNLLSYRPGLDRNAFTPYFFIGVGFVSYNPTAKYQGDVYELRSVMTEGQAAPYKNVAVTVPYGVGFKYNFLRNMSVIADMGYRTAFTDYLDDVSGNYADKTKFTNPVSLALSDRTGERSGLYTGSVGTQRGDGRAKDGYMFFTLSLTFTFLNDKCYFER